MVRQRAYASSNRYLLGLMLVQRGPGGGEGSGAADGRDCVAWPDSAGRAFWTGFGEQRQGSGNEAGTGQSPLCILT